MRMFLIAGLACLALVCSSYCAATELVRRPLYVEVTESGLLLLPNATDYKEAFGDEEARVIPTDEIMESGDLKRLLTYAMNHLGTEGPALNERDTIVTFLIRPDAELSFSKARAACHQFKQSNIQGIGGEDFGERFLEDTLFSKLPFPADAAISEVEELRRPRPRSVPRDEKGRPRIRQLRVHVRDGKLFPELVDETTTKAVERMVASLLKQNGVKAIKKNGYTFLESREELELLITDFNKAPPQDANFDLKLAKSGPFLVVVYEPKRDWSTNPEEIVRLAKQGQRHYCWLRFIVECKADAFVTYLSLRKATDSAGVLAGWELGDQNFSRPVALYRFGAPPPPPPKGVQTKRVFRESLEYELD